MLFTKPFQQLHTLHHFEDNILQLSHIHLILSHLANIYYVNLII